MTIKAAGSPSPTAQAFRSQLRSSWGAWIDSSASSACEQTSAKEKAPAQITSRTLRQIRVGQILDELVSSYTEPKNLRGLGSDYEPALWFWKESVELLDRAAKELPPVEPAKQGREPSREQLRAFVGQYASHLRRGKRNAMTRTTKEAHMARSTGYRWLRLASQAGLLEGLEDEA